MSQARNRIAGVSDGKNSWSAGASMFVNLGKTGIIDIAERGGEICCRLQLGRNPGGITRNFRTALGRDSREPIILVNKQLARCGGMSRSIFAQRFKEIVGSSPIEYLTRWRMLLAADRISNTRDSISEIAQSLGYESASAFTKAFKKIMGCLPRQYSRAI